MMSAQLKNMTVVQEGNLSEICRAVAHAFLSQLRLIEKRGSYALQHFHERNPIVKNVA